MGSLSHLGAVSTDQELQTAGQPGEAITLSEPLTLIWSKAGERGKKKHLYVENEILCDTGYLQVTESHVHTFKHLEELKLGSTYQPKI